MTEEPTPKGSRKASRPSILFTSSVSAFDLSMDLCVPILPFFHIANKEWAGFWAMEGRKPPIGRSPSPYLMEVLEVEPQLIGQVIVIAAIHRVSA